MPFTSSLSAFQIADGVVSVLHCSLVHTMTQTSDMQQYINILNNCNSFLVVVHGRAFCSNYFFAGISLDKPPSGRAGVGVGVRIRGMVMVLGTHSGVLRKVSSHHGTTRGPHDIPSTPYHSYATNFGWGSFYSDQWRGASFAGPITSICSVG